METDNYFINACSLVWLYTVGASNTHHDNTNMLCSKCCLVISVEYVIMLTFANKQQTQSTAEANGNAVIFAGVWSLTVQLLTIEQIFCGGW